MENQLHYFDPAWIASRREVLEVDVCVYGGTASGVVAAVAAARLGRRVVLLNPGRHLGGMTTGGLGWTDFGRQYVIGGLSRQFYRAVGRFYGKEEEWTFAPSAARHVIEQWVKDAGIAVHPCQYLESAQRQGNCLRAVTMLGGLTVRARQFIDATYEGDLMARAGVSFTVGREANSRYGETLNGIQVHKHHQFSHPVDPYVQEGVPASGLLPGIIAVDQTAHQGEGDHRVQAYNFRVCMTDDPALKIAWAKPAGFDPRNYVLATRWFNGTKDQYNEQLPGFDPAHPGVPRKFDVLPTKTPGGFRKTDTNNHGPVSSDFIGASWDWPLADYPARERLFQAHVAYQQGFYWHLAFDSAIPARYREAYAAWGLPRDEFEDTAHWPHQLYVREGRRMVTDYVVTEHDCRATRRARESVGMGSYNMDSHNCVRFVKQENGRARVLNDGDVQVPPTDPYPIPLAAIVPVEKECANLVVPVCFSASHIAYGSARMEPVFMALGESAAYIADQALAEGRPVQAIDYPSLRQRLLKAGQVLETPVRQ